MKSHRNILFISFGIGIASLIFVLALPQSTKGFQISIALMGSSLISFLLELPIFISIKKDNDNKLYYSLYDVKSNATILNTSINNMFNNDIVTDKFYEQNLQFISSSINNLRDFDQNYFLSKKKNRMMIFAINSICSAFENVKQSSLKYTCSYLEKRININKAENKDRNLEPSEVKIELNDILKYSNSLIETINTEASIIFSKSVYNIWKIDDTILINSNNNFKITQK